MNRSIRKMLLFCIRRRNAVRLAVLGAVVLALAAAVWTGKYGCDLAEMLPDGSDSAETYRDVVKSGLFNKAVLLFTSERGPFQNTEFLEETAEKLRANPLVESVDARAGAPDAFADGSFVRDLPRLLPPAELTDRDPVKTANMLYKRLLMPGGATVSMEGDPFGLIVPVLKRLEKLGRISGLGTARDSTYFLSPDRKNAFLLFSTKVSPADPAGSAKLLESLEEIRRSLPEGISCETVSAHGRAVYNETVLKRDVNTVAVVSFVLFTVFFLGFYRCDARSLLIPLIPLCASVLTLGIMACAFDRVQMFVVGMGGIVISLAVDYGIHTYAAMTGSGRPVKSLAGIAPALAAGALTSAAVFILFLLSSAGGMRELGFFAGTSLLLSLPLMLFLLPGFLHGSPLRETPFRIPAFPEKHPGLTILAFAAAGALCLAAVPFVKFRSDVRVFDASPESFDGPEKHYSEIFQPKGRPGIVIVKGADFDEMLRNCAAAAEILSVKGGMETFSPSEVCPAGEGFAGEWKRVLPEIGKLEQGLNREAVKRGFREGAFGGFFNRLREGIEHPRTGEMPEFARSVAERMTARTKDACYGLVFFPDTLENAGIARSLGFHTVSAHTFAQGMARDILNAAIPPGLLAAGLALTLLLLYFRNAGKTLFALLPACGAILAVCGFYAAAGLEANASTLIGCVILLGLSIDYGVFRLSPEFSRGMFGAMTLSALTTAAGGLTVVFTEHPMLRSAGITLTVGIAAAWMTAAWLLPALKKGFHAIPSGPVLLLLPLLLFAGGCASNPFEQPSYRPVPEGNERDILFRLRERTPVKLFLESGIAGEYCFHKAAVLAMMNLNSATGMIEAVGMTPAGGKIFEVRGTAEKPESFYWFPGEWSKYSEEASRIVLESLANLYLDTIPVPDDSTEFERRDGRLTVVRTAGDVTMTSVFADDPPKLISRTLSRNGSPVWKAEYCRYFADEAYDVPQWIYYRDFRRSFELAVRARRFEVIP